MSSPAPRESFFIFLFVLLLLFIIIQLQVIGFVFSKLGLSQNGASLLLFSSLFGSMLNLPLFRIRSHTPIQQPPLALMDSFWQRRLKPGYTLIALNTGGALIPVSFSIYLFYTHHLPFMQILIAISMTTFISFLVSTPIKGIGIGMPIFIAPITAALTALLLDPEHAAPLAYIGGTLGVLIGADLLRLGSIRDMGIPVAAIGGAGTFDGIFITGIIAVLLT
jgi:uncharacterized membrane protein